MLRDRALFSLCCSISLTLLTGSLHAEIYRWVDDDGVVNYAQRKPSNVDVVLIGKPARKRMSRTFPEVPTASSDLQETRLKLTGEQRKMFAALQQKEADRQVEITRIRSSNCKRSQALLQRLSANGRIRVRDSDGDERNLPDEERTERIAEAQRAIVVNCSSD